MIIEKFWEIKPFLMHTKFINNPDGDVDEHEKYDGLRHFKKTDK